MPWFKNYFSCFLRQIQRIKELASAKVKVGSESIRWAISKNSRSMLRVPLKRVVEESVYEEPLNCEEPIYLELNEPIYMEIEEALDSDLEAPSCIEMTAPMNRDLEEPNGIKSGHQPFPDNMSANLLVDGQLLALGRFIQEFTTLAYRASSPSINRSDPTTANPWVDSQLLALGRFVQEFTAIAYRGSSPLTELPGSVQMGRSHPPRSPDNFSYFELNCR